MRVVLVQLALAALIAAAHASHFAPSVGLRLPPELRDTADDDGCKSLLCAGSGKNYPIGPGIAYSSVFDVPPLPEVFNNASMTYYDYLNIFWRANPDGGWMNRESLASRVCLLDRLTR